MKLSDREQQLVDALRANPEATAALCSLLQARLDGNSEEVIKAAESAPSGTLDLLIKGLAVLREQGDFALTADAE